MSQLIWTMPRDSHLLLGGLDYAKLLFMNAFLHYYISTCSKLLPNKYMELNETKAIVGVPRLGSYSLYNYFPNAYPILGIMIEIENYKI